ncbi:MAG TPA: hypothetical protein VN253_12455, partial [Kofleriaceae bacterium]|nr:hypothetical protein [Kofleriaceae bacterium]
PKDPTMPKQPKPSQPQPQALQTIDPTALANVSGGMRTPAAAASSSGGGGGGGGGAGGDAVLSALNGILDSIHSLAGQGRQGGGFNAQEMMMFMMMLQQRNSPVQVVQPSLPVIYTNGTNRVF